MNADEIRAKYKQYLYGVATYYKEALPLVRGEGKWLFDADGKKYLDFFGGIVTVGLGHCDPRVVKAIEVQARTLQHTSTLFPGPSTPAACVSRLRAASAAPTFTPPSKT